ncbi:flagellar basal-body rod protein FlgG [bacterium]|nr:flagellar basal-body rod protein FlgG [bacterium]
MIRALYTGATGLNAQQRMTDVVANNIANVNTYGFKKDRTEFEDLIYQEFKRSGTEVSPGVLNPNGLNIGLGTHIVATIKDFTMGSYLNTERALDVIIEGEGFLQFTLPDGTTGYSRDGSLKLDANGQIVNSNGHVLEPAIILPPDALAITIQSDGTFWYTAPGDEAPTQAGQITTVRFINPSGLSPAGKNIFLATAGSGEPIEGIPGEEGFGTIQQGFIENSNVQIADEMIKLIIAQRAFESNSKSIQTADDILSIAANLKR